MGAPETTAASEPPSELPSADVIIRDLDHSCRRNQAGEGPGQLGDQRLSAPARSPAGLSDAGDVEPLGGTADMAGDPVDHSCRDSTVFRRPMLTFPPPTVALIDFRAAAPRFSEAVVVENQVIRSANGSGRRQGMR